MSSMFCSSSFCRTLFTRLQIYLQARHCQHQYRSCPNGRAGNLLNYFVLFFFSFFTVLSLTNFSLHYHFLIYNQIGFKSYHKSVGTLFPPKKKKKKFLKRFYFCKIAIADYLSSSVALLLHDSAIDEILFNSFNVTHNTN